MIITSILLSFSHFKCRAYNKEGDLLGEGEGTSKRFAKNEASLKALVSLALKSEAARLALAGILLASMKSNPLLTQNLTVYFLQRDLHLMILML